MTLTMPKAAGLSLHGLTKEFAGKRALDGVTLDVAPGTFLVLLGPSGSGKTTLLRCLAGIERPTSGSIRIGDRDVVNDRVYLAPEKRKLAMVFQDYALWPHLSVARNVGFPLRDASLTSGERNARVQDLLERVGIAHLRDSFPNQLSGGEQQRVALARALAADVGLILFDEPLSNLDADRRELLRIEIATLTREAGATAVYITHDQSEAFALADQVGVLNHGRLVQLDRPETIYRQPASAFVARFTGVSGEFPVDGLRVLPDGTAEVSAPFADGVRLRAQLPAGVPERPVLFARSAGVHLREASADGVGALVRDVAFTGRGYEHVVDVGHERTLSKVFATTRFDRDTLVKVKFDPDACFVLDEMKVS